MTDPRDTAGSPGGVSAGPLLGIGLLVGAELLFAGMDTIAKHLGQSMPVGMVVWGRYAFHLGFMLLFLVPSVGLKRLVRVRRLGLVLLRGVLLLLATTCFFTAISFIPLADAVAIGFVAPLFVVALSIPLLGERVGPRRWAAVLVGFLGVMVIVRPGFGEVHWAYGLMIVLALIFAIFVITTRILTRTEDTLPMLFFTALVGTAGASLTLPFLWQTPTLGQWGWMAAMGAIGGTSHMILIQAYRVADASVLAPFQYAQILFAAAFGYLAFGDFPDAWVWTGTAIVIASGLYVLFREAQLAGRQ